jgi:hypothetical protein
VRTALVALQSALRRSARSNHAGSAADVRMAEAEAEAEAGGEAGASLVTPGVQREEGLLDEKARQIAGQALRMLKDVLAAGQNTSGKAD